MAKPIQGQPGSSGHIHISLCSPDGNNLFARETQDPNAPWPDAAAVSDLGRHFLAGLLEALPDIMPLFAPTVNSYKRLVENYWAPINISWGLEDRTASIRVIAPPVCKPGATRFEIRIPGADLHPHYALAAILAAGWRGVQKKVPINVPPLSAITADMPRPELLPNTLDLALKRFGAEGSIAREILKDEFVDFFVATREHELRVWREAVTDWFVYPFILFWLLKLTAIGSLSGILRPYSPLSIHGCYHVSFLSSAGQIPKYYLYPLLFPSNSIPVNAELL